MSDDPGRFAPGGALDGTADVGLVRLRLDGLRPRRWHAGLIARLGDGGARRVEVDDRPGPRPWPGNADRLFRIEAALHGLPRGGPAARAQTAAGAARAPASERAPDLVIDLCGDVAPAGPVRVWRLLYDGEPGEATLLASLLAGRVPLARLVEGERVVCEARLGTEVRGVVRTMFEDALARTATLILAGLAGGAAPLGADPTPQPTPPPEPRLTAPALARRAAGIAARSLVGRAYRAGFRAPHWRVGWRRLEGPDLAALGRHPAGGWRVMPDDGLRFYADPFPIVRDGRLWLFVEDYVHARGKGVISAVAFDADGPAGTPVPVLETPGHLSYPFVFEAEGAAWMVPESCAAGTIDLYRATAFPGGWVREATLVSGLAASDATLFARAGRWWMFATVREAPAAAPLGHGSYSDALYLWSAPDFRGPWTPHRANPVLIDAAAARPAGRLLVRDGTVIRPVQDCSRGYGWALGLMRVERLDAEGFAQSPVARVEAGPLWPGTRIHTLNGAGGFEFIDGSARVPRFLPRRLLRPRP